MDFGPLDMLQLMHTVYAVPPTPVEPIAPVPFVPGDFSDMWCRNPAGDKVEWWIVYNAPAGPMTRGSGEAISNGAHYGYIDSATKLDATVRMQLFDDIAGTEKNALYNTLEVLFKYPRGFLVEKNLTFLAYSDRPPAELSNSSTNGIAKGVLLFGQNSGAWVSHTFDGFGHFFQEKFLLPDEPRREAQTALCMSLKADNWPKIVAHLRRESPNIYDWNIPPMLFEANPGLKQLVEKSFNHEEPGAESNILIGVNGTDFMAFSKNAVHNFDIYETLVAPQLETNIYIRGTEDGDQHLDNYCNDFNLTEVEEVELKLGQDVVFKKIRKSQDNSRWAISERDYWVCFGSVQRRKSHLPRGAEVFCFQNQPANILLANSIDKFASCKPLPEEIAAKVAAAPPGTAVSLGNSGGTYVRPAIIRPSFGVPRVYYGGLPSFGLGFPFKKILKNPIVVGAAVAGVMHYRHKQQIKKLNTAHALASGYGGRSYPSPSFGGGSSGAYGSGLAGMFGSKTPNAPGYPTMGGGYPTGHHAYPVPGYPGGASSYHPSSYGHHNPGYPAAPHSYPSPGGYPPYPSGGGSHGYPNAGGAHGYPSPGYPTAPKSAYPTAPGASYPSQPAFNPSYNPARSTASAPSAPTARNAPKQQSSNVSAGSNNSKNKNSNTASRPSIRTSRPQVNNRPVRVEKTVTRTVTSYGSNRGSSRGSSRGSGSRSRGGRIGKG